MNESMRQANRPDIFKQILKHDETFLGKGSVKFQRYGLERIFVFITSLIYMPTTNKLMIIAGMATAM